MMLSVNDDLKEVLAVCSLKEHLKFLHSERLWCSCNSSFFRRKRKASMVFLSSSPRLLLSWMCILNDIRVTSMTACSWAFFVGRAAFRSTSCFMGPTPSLGVDSL